MAHADIVGMQDGDALRRIEPETPIKGLRHDFSLE
jgi:hypothetical protein